MRIISPSILVPLALIGAIGVVSAETYPVSGDWTYENAEEVGPAKTCGKKIMRFEGNVRSDTGTAAPKYKNISATRNGPGNWKMVDEFYNLQTWGRVQYTLRIVDQDHIELSYDRIPIQQDRGAGKSYLLRRCA